MTGNIPRYHEDNDLVGLLQEMDPYDRDLWHVIASESEPGWPADENALYWIFAQPTCDRASVAAFVQRYADLGYMASRVASDLKHEKTQFADQLAKIIGRWNDGFYQTAELGFSGQDLESAEREFLRQRAEAHAMLDREPWGVPEDLFRSFSGRTPQPSLCFRYGEGLMKLPPRPEDYFTSMAAGQT